MLKIPEVLPQITRSKRIMSPNGAVLEEEYLSVKAETFEKAKEIMDQEWQHSKEE